MRIDKKRPPQNADAQTEENSLSESLRLLGGGMATLIDELRKIPKEKMKHYFMELENIRGFLETLEFIRETMPEERLHETIRNTVKSIRKAFENIPRAAVSQMTAVSVDPACGLPDFLFRVMRLLGPTIRINKNQMSAWIEIDSEEAAFFTPECVLEGLKRKNVVRGVMESQVQEIFETSIFNQEVLIAKGKSPTFGQDGRIEFKIQVEDMGRTPKKLLSGRVSFKDIKLFDYIALGNVLAEKIPPAPGTPGYTVTDRVLAPPEAREAQFPDCEYTKISEDGKTLLATENCCVTKKDGRILLEPSLIVSGNVSYETGNLDSQVAIIVQKDVLPDFLIRCEKDIHVQGTVEAARLEAKGNIVIKGGVLGKDKALLEASGDISARFIANATATSLNQIVVESEIMNSKIWSGGRVIVAGAPGQIVGGEIDADADVVADTIGSELGVKTVIRLGGKIEDLSALILETQQKIAEQEEAMDKCGLIIDTLKQQIAQSPAPPEELKQALDRARDMSQKIRYTYNDLIAESDGLQVQYEESLKRTRTVRARKNIMPGVVIQIQGAELAVKKPTGPATVVKQGDELAVFPFKEIDAS
ncbi:MAG: FapA family protein [Candidatus Omnitrophota bacterium]